MEILLLSFLSLKALLRIRPYTESWGLGELRFARVCGSNLVTLLHSTASDQCCTVSMGRQAGHSSLLPVRSVAGSLFLGEAKAAAKTVAGGTASLPTAWVPG